MVTDITTALGTYGLCLESDGEVRALEKSWEPPQEVQVRVIIISSRNKLVLFRIHCTARNPLYCLLTCVSARLLARKLLHSVGSNWLLKYVTQFVYFWKL